MSLPSGQVPASRMSTSCPAHAPGNQALRVANSQRRPLFPCSMLRASLCVPLAFVCLLGEEEAHLSQPLQPGQQAGAAWVTVRCEAQPTLEQLRVYNSAWHAVGRLIGTAGNTTRPLVLRPHTCTPHALSSLLQAGRRAGRADRTAPWRVPGGARHGGGCKASLCQHGTADGAHGLLWVLGASLGSAVPRVHAGACWSGACFIRDAWHRARPAALYRITACPHARHAVLRPCPAGTAGCPAWQALPTWPAWQPRRWWHQLMGRLLARCTAPW